MTPQEKANITRTEHKEAQRRKEERKQFERDLIRDNLCAVLLSEEATPTERLESSKLLLELTKRP